MISIECRFEGPQAVKTRFEDAIGGNSPIQGGWEGVCMRYSGESSWVEGHGILSEMHLKSTGCIW